MALNNAAQQLNRGYDSDPPPPIFSANPGEDFRTWLYKFELYANDREWDNDTKARKIGLYLNGEAFTHFEYLKANEQATYDAIKNALDRKINPGDNQAHLYTLMKREQKPGESVTQYHTALLRGLVQANPGVALDQLLQTNSNWLKTIFMSGVDERIKRHLMNSDALTFDDLVKKAIIIESNTHLTSNSSSENEIKAMLIQLTQRLNLNSDSTQTQANSAFSSDNRELERKIDQILKNQNNPNPQPNHTDPLVAKVTQILQNQSNPHPYDNYYELERKIDLILQNQNNHPIPQNQNTNSWHHIECFNCHRFGHKSSNCRSRTHISTPSNNNRNRQASVYTNHNQNIPQNNQNPQNQRNNAHRAYGTMVTSEINPSYTGHDQFTQAQEEPLQRFEQDNPLIYSISALPVKQRKINLNDSHLLSAPTQRSTAQGGKIPQHQKKGQSEGPTIKSKRPNPAKICMETNSRLIPYSHPQIPSIPTKVATQPKQSSWITNEKPLEEVEKLKAQLATQAESLRIMQSLCELKDSENCTLQKDIQQMKNTIAKMETSPQVNTLTQPEPASENISEQNNGCPQLDKANIEPNSKCNITNDTPPAAQLPHETHQKDTPFFSIPPSPKKAKTPNINHPEFSCPTTALQIEPAHQLTIMEIPPEEDNSITTLLTKSPPLPSQSLSLNPRRNSAYLSAGTMTEEDLENFHSTAPIVKVKIAGATLLALADTGSGVTIISEEAARSIRVKWSPPNAGVLSLTGHQAEITASAMATITLGKVKVYHKILVQKDAPIDCILGSDLFTKLGNVCFNFSSRKLALKCEAIPFEITSPTNPKKHLCSAPSLNIKAYKNFHKDKKKKHRRTRSQQLQCTSQESLTQEKLKNLERTSAHLINICQMIQASRCFEKHLREKAEMELEQLRTQIQSSEQHHNNPPPGPEKLMNKEQQHFSSIIDHTWLWWVQFIIYITIAQIYGAAQEFQPVVENITSFFITFIKCILYWGQMIWSHLLLPSSRKTNLQERKRQRPVQEWKKQSPTPFWF